MAKKRKSNRKPNSSYPAINWLIIVGLAIILILRLIQLLSFFLGIGNPKINQSILLFMILLGLAFIAITAIFLIFAIKRKKWAYWGIVSLAVLQFSLMDFSVFTPLSIFMTCLNVTLTFGPLWIIYSSYPQRKR